MGCVMTLFMSAIVVLPTLWLLLLLRAESAQLADRRVAGRLHFSAFVDRLPMVGSDIAAWLNTMLAEPTRLKTELKAHLGSLDAQVLALLDERAGGYLDSVAVTTRAVVYGIVLTALVQGPVLLAQQLQRDQR